MITLELSDILTATFIFVGLFLAILLVYIIKILANISRIIKRVSETVDVVTEYIWKPINYAQKIYKKTEKTIDGMKEKRKKKEDENK